LGYSEAPDNPLAANESIKSSGRRTAIFFLTFFGIIVAPMLAGWSWIWINHIPTPMTISDSDMNTITYVALACVLPMIFLMSYMGSSAATLKPNPGGEVADEDLLRKQILEINHLQLPFHVREDHEKLVIEWRFNDPEWETLLKKGGRDQQHRMYMVLDTEQKIVRVIERDTSIAITPLSGSFHFSQTIKYPQYDPAAAYGFTLQNDRLMPEPGYEYDYTDDEMRKPLIYIVLTCGWEWKPVMSLIRWIGS
jgi:hypothetical protein